MRLVGSFDVPLHHLWYLTLLDTGWMHGQRSWHLVTAAGRLGDFAGLGSVRPLTLLLEVLARACLSP